MSKIAPVRRGESLPFEFDRGGLTIDGWICTIIVKEFADDTALISGPVTPADGVWSGFLTSTQTATLTAGDTYRLFAILTNATTDEEEQVEARFSLSSSWAS